MDCHFCTVPSQAFAVIPMPEGAVKKSIPVCPGHEKIYATKGYSFEDLNGNPFRESRFYRIIDAKHYNLRGTSRLKFKKEHHDNSDRSTVRS